MPWGQKHYHCRVSVPAAFTQEQRELRCLILDVARAANKGHIGSALSIADILLAVDRIAEASLLERHQTSLVLSKGHAASALYALMALRGHIDMRELLSYCANGSPYGTHPSLSVPGVTFATGSLGQGIGFAVGMALADRLRARFRRTLCILSDAEIDEGSSWEAFLIAAHYKLENLTVMVDCNGQQALGTTQSVLDTSGFGAAISALGWDMCEVDGHDVESLIASLQRPWNGKPKAILCRTNSGSGVSFMERRVEWHYLPMSDEEHALALLELTDGKRS